MADTKISALSAVTTAAATDEFPVNQGGTTLKETNAQLLTYMQTVGANRTTRLGSQHSISSVTGTKVTGLDQTLEAGTFCYKYWLLVRSSTGADGPMLGVNFTGTGSPRQHFRFADATTVITAEVHSMDDQGIKGAGFISGMASSAKTTTSPDMGTTVGVASTATDILCFIEGMIIVTVSGNLELWHSSESTNATSVEVGSSLVVVRTA